MLLAGRAASAANEHRRRPKVAIFVAIVPNKLGSMEDWLYQLAAQLAVTSEVSVATYAPCHPTIRERLTRSGVRWYDLSEIERTVKSARSWIKEHAEVAHFSLFAPRDFIVVAAASVGRTQVIFQDCYSTLPKAQRQSIPSKVLDRFSFLRTKRVVAISKYVATRIKKRFGLNERRIRVIYNGVDMERFQGVSRPSQSSDIVCVAALVEGKGVDVLIRALVDQKLEGQRLVICGDGEQRPALEDLAKRHGLADRVEFMGLRDDVHNFVSNAALVVHPAYWGEGFGLTIAEAMAAGRPVIGCMVGAVPELISDGVTGFVVPPSDPSAMAEAILKLWNNPMLRDEMGSAGRLRAEKYFSMSQWVNEHVKLVLELTASNTGQSLSETPAPIHMSADATDRFEGI